jgi:hypothetical protein
VLQFVPAFIRLGGIVDGLTGRIVCRNYVRRMKQKSTVSDLSWECNNLQTHSGARVEVTLVGHATGPVISGLFTGLEVSHVACTNNTNRKRVTGTPAPTWECSDLPITTGDKITIRVHGKVS